MPSIIEQYNALELRTPVVVSNARAEICTMRGCLHQTLVFRIQERRNIGRLNHF